VTSLTGRRVLVTGADGFIGSHLVERLVRDGAEVRALCMYNSLGGWGWLDRAPEAVQKSVDVRLGDIRDTGFVAAICEDQDVIFHLAALIAIPYSYTAPSSFIETNVGGTMNVLEAARRHGVGRLVHTSTSEVYGTPDSLPIRETHPLRAQSPYAASKIGADQLVLAYHSSFGVPAVILRPFNTYGPRQSARALVATILSQLLAGKREVELGRTDTRRDLTYVADTVDAFLLAGAVEGISGTTIQLGTGRTWTVREVFDLAVEITGVSAELREDQRRLRPEASEVLVLQAAADRAQQLLGWRANTTLEDGIRLTAEWLQQNMHFYRPDLLHE
jgi:NAD dependent epimerase/dehydratase